MMDLSPARTQNVPHILSDLPATGPRERLAFDSDDNIIEREGPERDKVEYLRPWNARAEQRAVLVADLADSERLPVDLFVAYHDRMAQAIVEAAYRTRI